MRLVLLSIGLVLSMAIAGCDYFRGTPERIERAKELTVQHQYRAAAIELKNVVEKEPNHTQARLLLADILLAMGEPQAAQRDLDTARANGAEAQTVNDIEARILLTTGRYEDAIAKLADADYRLAEPRRSLYAARANLGLQRYAQALALFDAVLANTSGVNATGAANAQSDMRLADMQLTDTRLDAQLGRIETRAGMGEIAASLNAVADILRDDATLASAWSLQGMLQTRIGQVEQALASLQEAHRHAERQLLVKQHADVLSLLIELQLGRRNLAGAEQALRELNKLLPGTLLTRLLQARITVAKQDLPNAAADLQRIVRAAPDVAPAQFLLGMVLLQQGNINQAELHLSRAVALAPQHLEARKLLAQAQLRLDRPQAAIQSLMPVLDDPGVDLQVHGLLGLAEKQAGLESNSIEYLSRALAEQPNNDHRKLELAIAYVRGAKYDEAVALLRSIDEPKLAAQRAALLAAALARTQGVSSARNELEAQFARDPNNTALMGVLADFYGQNGQAQRGVDLMTEALRRAPNDSALLIARARLLASRGDAIGAERDLKAALTRRSDDHDVLLALAELSYRRGDVASTLDWLNRLSKNEPDNVQVEMLKARALLSAKQPAAAQQATDLLDKLVQTHAERSDIRSAAARLYVGAGRYEEALAHLRAAAGLAKQDATIQLEIARTQVALNQFDDARNTVSELLRQQPTLLPAVALAAWLDIERRAHDAAVARIEALRKLQPNDPRVAAAAGEIFMAVGKSAPAAEAFEAALQRQPSVALAVKTYLARAAARLPSPAEPLQKFVDRNPQDLAARAALAQAYQQLGDVRGALAQYEKLQADGVSSPVVLNNLAWLYSEAADPRGLSIARQAVAQAPDNSSIADTLGWILAKQGQYAEAVSVLKAAAAGAPNDAEIRYHYAVVLAKTGALQEARRAVDEALRQTGSFPSRAEAERLQKELSNRSDVNG